MMYPRFLIHCEKGIYLKINSNKGDGILIDHKRELITTGDRNTIYEIDKLSIAEMLEMGYVEIPDNDFYDMYESVNKQFTRQLIRK